MIIRKNEARNNGPIRLSTVSPGVAFKGIWQAINGISPVNIEKTDSLWSTFLSAEGIYNRHFIDFTLGNDTLLASSLPDNQNPTNLLATQKIGVNSDDSIGMQGFIIAPGETCCRFHWIIGAGYGNNISGVSVGRLYGKYCP